MKDLNVIIRFLSSRVEILLSLIVVAGGGFFLWQYDGPGRVWIKYYATGVVYEVFWCLVVFLIWPRKRYAFRIAVGVFLVTCILEVLQLWKPLFLQKIRSTYLGAALIGTSFVWWQFPHYVMGSVLGFVFIRILGQRYEKKFKDRTP